MKDTRRGSGKVVAAAVALPLCSRAAAPMTLAGLGATSPAHLRACPWCRRFYGPTDRRGWRLADAALVGLPSVRDATGTPACAACGRRVEPGLRLSLTRAAPGQDEALLLLVCRACGHVEPLDATAAA